MHNTVSVLLGTVLLGFSSGLSFDCGTIVEGSGTMTIPEVLAKGTTIATFNNTIGGLELSAFLNDTRSDYLTRFFTSTQLDTGDDDTRVHNLELAEVLDLELLAFELSTYELYSDEFGGIGLTLEVTCRDVNRQRKTTLLTIDVEPVNEFVPLFIGAPYKQKVPESTKVGEELMSLTELVSDVDAGDTNFLFTIAPYRIAQYDGSRYASITSDGHITLAQPIDFEALPSGRSYMFVNVTVTDDGGLTSSTSINVTFTDVNDQGVQFVYPNCSRPCVEASYTIYTNTTYVGELTTLPVPLVVEDLDTLEEPVVYTLTTDEELEPFFLYDKIDGSLYKNMDLVNDTFGDSFVIKVRASEVSNSEHYVESNITVLIEDRLQSTSFSTLVPLHERSDIKCLPNIVSIFLPDTIIPGNRSVTWREEDCNVAHNGTHYVSSVALSDCGTTVKIENDTVTFSNDLIVHKAADDQLSDVDSDITYGSDIETVIPVQCIYPRHSNLSTSYTPVKQNVRFFEKRYGELQVSMQQYVSNEYTEPLASDGSPRKVPLNDDVFIKIGLNFDPSELKIRADQCIATSSPSPADKNWRNLIQQSCPLNDAKLLSDEESKDFRFTFKAFDFRHNSSGFVFIHCQVSVCSDSDVTCKLGCGSRTKRSAQAYHSVDSHLVSTGPLFIERPASSSRDVTVLPMLFAGVCLLVAMVAVILAITARRRQSQITK